MEGIRKAMNERNQNEGQWEDRKQWSLGVGQRRKIIFETGVCVCVCVCNMYIKFHEKFVQWEPSCSRRTDGQT
jgi:hypothetical protein